MPIYLTESARERQKAADARRAVVQREADVRSFNDRSTWVTNAERAARNVAAEQQPATAARPVTEPAAATPKSAPIDMSKMTAQQKLALGRQMERDRREAAAAASPVVTTMRPAAVNPIDLSKMTAQQKLALGLRLSREGNGGTAA